jgi:hypothetical protein
MILTVGIAFMCVVGEWEVKMVFEGNLFGELDFEISTFPSFSFTLQMEKFPGAGMVWIAADSLLMAGLTTACIVVHLQQRAKEVVLCLTWKVTAYIF